MNKRTRNNLNRAADLLELAANQFSNHGCNDFEIEDTPENRKFASAVDAYILGNDATDSVMCCNDKIIISDNDAMSYLAEVFRDLAE